MHDRRFQIAHEVGSRDPIYVHQGVHMGVFGSTGGGKSASARALVASALRACPETCVVILDPKRIGFCGASHRGFVLKNNFLQALNELVKEMKRRYGIMEKQQVSDGLCLFSPIMIVVDELWMLTHSQPSQGKNEELGKQLEILAMMGRQAGIQLVLCAQSARNESFGKAGTAIRNQLTDRIVLRLLSEQEVNMASGDRAEECMALSLKPGEAQISTSATNFEYVRGQFPYLDAETFGAVINSYGQKDTSSELGQALASLEPPAPLRGSGRLQ